MFSHYPANKEKKHTEDQLHAESFHRLSYLPVNTSSLIEKIFCVFLYNLILYERAIFVVHQRLGQLYNTKLAVTSFPLETMNYKHIAVVL